MDIRVKRPAVRYIYPHPLWLFVCPVFDSLHANSRLWKGQGARLRCMSVHCLLNMAAPHHTHPSSPFTHTCTHTHTHTHIHTPTYLKPSTITPDYYSLLGTLMSWLCRVHLSLPLHPDHLQHAQQHCRKTLPLLATLLPQVPATNTKLQLSLLEFIYWAVTHLTTAQQVTRSQSISP